MRPLKLSLKGFTAFRDEQSVDFSHLDIFAIAGPTGAGKSSILDAMTYALYGKVERVSNECSQLISQGLPSMVVQFEFACGNDQYRVARRTSRKSPTDVVLERLADGEWVSEAGKVREVGQRIEQIIGLDYDGFTRAVLLPQGKFDQFLAGDAGARRKILTDLLGLQIFERMAAHARKRAAASEVESKTTRKFLETEFKHVSTEAVDAARDRATEAGKHEKQLDAIYKTVREFDAKWKGARKHADELEAYAREAAGYASTAVAAGKQLRRLSKQDEDAREAVVAKRKALRTAGFAAQKAQEAYAAGIAKLGSLKDLSSGRAKAEQLQMVQKELVKLRSGLANLESAPPKLQTLAKHVAELAAEALKVEAGAKTGVARARTELEDLQHDERVAAIGLSLRIGDPCPICGMKITKLPKAAPGAPRLKAARAKLASAEQALEAGRQDSADLKLKAVDTERMVRTAEDALERAQGEVAEREKRVVDLEKTLGVLLGRKLPPHPIAALDERVARIEQLEADADAAAEQKGKGEAALSDADRLSERITSAVATEANRVPIVAATGLLKRAQKLVESVALPPVDLRIDAARSPEQRALFAESFGGGLEECADMLNRLAHEQSRSESKLFADAVAATRGLVPSARDLDALGRAAEEAARSATREAAEAEKAAKDLADSLVRKLKLAADLAELEQSFSRLHAMALDLRSDAIVDYLQAQALDSLAREGSKQLRQLSAERYELRYRNDEFYVADVWNGDEERSVKTLSGGETFMASLALALSLSGQVRALSSNDHARLDSLFLDEGFGSLDRTAVDLVIDGLEMLGSDGRMVGVITHVREITDVFPRIEVEKLATGSRLSLVA